MLLLTLGTMSVHAAVLLSEEFNYPNGPIAIVSDGSWNTHGGTSGQIMVTNAAVLLQSAASEDVNTLVGGQPYPASDDTILYVGCTVNFSTLPSPNGGYFAHLKGGGTLFRAKLFALRADAPVGKFRIGIANGSNTPSAIAPADLQLNTDYRLYLRYVVNTSVATLWVEPDSETAPSVTATDAVSNTTITSFALREDNGIGGLALSSLRIGTSFADVYTGPNSIPPTFVRQPVSVAAIVGGVAVFSAEAVGSAPLQYQWCFDDLIIPDATNSTLLLASVATNHAGRYSVTVANPGGATNSLEALLTIIPPNTSGTLTVVHYNVKGNFASDWTTNAPQVQAIARQLRYLQPDIITLNEIPNGSRFEMTNWMAAFFPTHYLAVSPGTDGVLRSGVISRFPFVSSNSWLAGASLTNYGYEGAFTRDLFETEILVPGATEPLHVFTTHLKSAADADSQRRRAAECSAISNFFATIFLPTNGFHAYLLTGDLNEDIDLPMSQNLQAIQRLTNNSGLILTTPLNPFALTRFTHSIQGSLDARFDYVLPNGLLASNIVGSQVFRTDLLPLPLPPELNHDDDLVASDHLPVVTVFRYPDPPLAVSLSVNAHTVTLTWPALMGRAFRVEASPDLNAWNVVAGELTATQVQTTWTGPATVDAQFYRVIRLP